MLQAPFTPLLTSQTVAATAASSSVTLAKPNMSVLRFYNFGPNIAFVRMTAGASTATITDMPIPVGVVESFSKGGSDVDTVSVICAATQTATVYVTQGEGA